MTPDQPRSEAGKAANAVVPANPALHMCGKGFCAMLAAAPKPMALIQPIKPTPAEILAARKSIQTTLNLGITAAQDWCALAVHSKRRPWQQWETGERGMHPAFWELFRIKAALIART